MASTEIPNDMEFINMKIQSKRPDGKPAVPIWVITKENMVSSSYPTRTVTNIFLRLSLPFLCLVLPILFHFASVSSPVISALSHSLSPFSNLFACLPVSFPRWFLPRRGSRPVSTVLRKTVNFFSFFCNNK